MCKPRTDNPAAISNSAHKFHSQLPYFFCILECCMEQLTLRQPWKKTMSPVILCSWQHNTATPRHPRTWQGTAWGPFITSSVPRYLYYMTVSASPAMCTLWCQWTSRHSWYLKICRLHRYLSTACTVWPSFMANGGLVEKCCLEILVAADGMFGCYCMIWKTVLQGKPWYSMYSM